MPTVRTTDQVIAILCSDIHLSHRCPVARDEEPDWYSAMARPLAQLRDLAAKHHAPVLCAGDIFDKWNSPPELINFALKHLPDMIAVPGQHDLPYHNMDLIDKSAFWTLVQAGKVIIPDRLGMSYGGEGKLTIFGFPWGTPLTGPPAVHSVGRFKLALVHKYIWIDGCGYPGASHESHLLTMPKNSLTDYDLAVFGDNHMAFITSEGNTQVYNPGTLMRRKADEIPYRPTVGLLHRSGKIEIHFLDDSEDIITELDDLPQSRELKENPNLSDFMEKLSRLQTTGIDFRDAMLQMLEATKPPAAVRRIVLDALGE